jgi:hypothetical protein
MPECRVAIVLLISIPLASLWMILSVAYITSAPSFSFHQSFFNLTNSLSSSNPPTLHSQQQSNDNTTPKLLFSRLKSIAKSRSSSLEAYLYFGSENCQEGAIEFGSSRLRRTCNPFRDNVLWFYTSNKTLIQQRNKKMILGNSFYSIAQIYAIGGIINPNYGTT